MKNKVKFLEKLKTLLAVAKDNGGSVTIEQVKQHFEEGALNDEQMELVFDYLLSQKIVVKGYVTMEEDKPELTEEEKAYLEEYEKELQILKAEKEDEKEELFGLAISGDSLAKQRLIEVYLKEVIEIAKEMRHPDIFLADLVQEGNVGLLIGVDSVNAVETAHDTIISQIRQSMQMLIEEQEEEKNHDDEMVKKVSVMDAAITELTEELGRKVTIEELAVHMGISEEDVMDILKLTGEEQEEEETKE